MRSLAALAIAILPLAALPARAGLSHGPLLGAVSESSIRVWVRADAAALVEVIAEPGPIQQSTALAAASDFTGVVELSGLAADTTYTYRVLLDAAEVFAGTFRTLPPQGVPGSLRFAFAADIRLAQQPYTLFDAVVTSDPDFLILGGDNIYADHPTTVADTKAAYEARYRDTWSDASLRAALQVVPTFMTWDDHEIINDWYPGLDARYANARAAYEEYQHSHNPDALVPGDLYYTFAAGEVDFFVLDTRSHRSPNGDPDGPAKSMLGIAQRDHLLAWLSASEARFKVIVSSVPFHDWATTGNDAWNGIGASSGAFRSERDAIFDYIRSQAIPDVVLVSGDQHWAGAFALGAGTPDPVIHEFMPTPIATSNRAPPATSDPQVLYANGAQRGFGLFDVDTASEPATLRFQWRDASGVLFELEIEGSTPVPVPSLPLAFSLALLALSLLAACTLALRLARG